MTSSGQGTLINIFAGDPIHVTELVTSSAIALVGAIDISTLLAARAVETLVHIFTRPAVHRQPEAGGAAAVEGAWRVLTLVATQAPGIALALVDIHAGPADAIKIEASLALAAEAAGGVQAVVSLPTGLRWWGALIHINTAGPLFIEMITTATVGHILLACVGALCIDACLPHRAWSTDT